MKTRSKVLIILVLIGLVAIPALLLVGAATANQELLEDLIIDSVVSNVDGYPEIDGTVESIPDDCIKCHDKEKGS